MMKHLRECGGGAQKRILKVVLVLVKAFCWTNKSFLKNRENRENRAVDMAS